MIYYSSDKNIQGASNGTLADIHAYAKGIESFLVF
jgi:hypothetical protein